MSDSSSPFGPPSFDPPQTPIGEPLAPPPAATEPPEGDVVPEAEAAPETETELIEAVPAGEASNDADAEATGDTEAEATGDTEAEGVTEGEVDSVEGAETDVDASEAEGAAAESIGEGAVDEQPPAPTLPPLTSLISSTPPPPGSFPAVDAPLLPSSGPAPTTVVPAVAPAPKKSSPLPWILAALLLIAAGVFAFLWVKKSGDLDDANKANATAVAGLNDQVAKIQKDAADAQKKAADDLAGAQKKVADLTKQSTDLQTQLDAAKAQAAQAEQNGGEAQQKIDDLTKQVGDLTAQAKDVQTKLDDATKQATDLQAQLDKQVPVINAVKSASIALGKQATPTANPALTDDEALCVGSNLIDAATLDQLVTQGSALLSQQIVAALPNVLSTCSIDPARIPTPTP